MIEVLVESIITKEPRNDADHYRFQVRAENEREILYLICRYRERFI